MNNSGYKILITGGSGFLGSRIIKELVTEDCPIPVESIINFDLNRGDLSHPKLTFVQGDIRDYSSIEKMDSKFDLVLHCAAMVDWGTRRPKEVLDVNFGGTRNLVDYCKANKIQNLVYTSSLDTVFNGKDLVNINESQPYPDSYPNMYCKSKFMAERLVLESNSEELKTSVIRPADIYGEGDIYHIESLINMARSGFYIRLGNGKTKSQHVYVGNVAFAHVLLAKALLQTNSKVFGQCYFITDGAGENFFKFFDRIVEGSGYKIWPGNLWLPKWLGYLLGLISESIALLVRPFRYYNPKLSRFAVLYTCCNFTFTSEKAKADFNFSVKYDVDEHIDLTCKFYANQREIKKAVS